VGEFDLLRHPLDPLLSPLGYLGGSATLDDGRLVIILSIPGLVRRAEARPFAMPRPGAAIRPDEGGPGYGAACGAGGGRT